MATPSIPKTSGIYQITCTANGKIYIGSTDNLRRRCLKHFSILKRNEHINRHLQNAYNKYGKEAFRIDILELVMPWSLLDREQYWLDLLKPYQRNIGFNINRYAEATTKGRHHTPETRARISSTLTGIKRSPESCDKMRTIALARTPEDIEKRAVGRRKIYILTSPEGVEFEVKGLTSFCREYGLSSKHIYGVATGKRPHHRGWKCRYR